MDNQRYFKAYANSFDYGNYKPLFIGKDLMENFFYPTLHKIKISSKETKFVLAYQKKVADNFKVTHMSFDAGYIPEAFEDTDLKIWAVQWHPERDESADNTYPLDKISRF